MPEIQFENSMPDQPDKATAAALKVFQDPEYILIRAEYKKAEASKDKFNKEMAEKYRDAPKAKALVEKYPDCDEEHLTKEQSDYASRLGIAGDAISGKLVIMDKDDKKRSNKLSHDFIQQGEILSNIITIKLQQEHLSDNEMIKANKTINALDNIKSDIEKKNPPHPKSKPPIIASIDPDHQPQAPLPYSAQAQAVIKDLSRHS